MSTYSPIARSAIIRRLWEDGASKLRPDKEGLTRLYNEANKKFQGLLPAVKTESAEVLRLTAKGVMHAIVLGDALNITYDFPKTTMATRRAVRHIIPVGLIYVHDNTYSFPVHQTHKFKQYRKVQPHFNVLAYQVGPAVEQPEGVTIHSMARESFRSFDLRGISYLNAVEPTQEEVNQMNLSYVFWYHATMEDTLIERESWLRKNSEVHTTKYSI